MSGDGSCPVCGSASRAAFERTVLGRHRCAYFQCADCGLLHTQPPYWLDEAYASALADTDTGLVQRNLALASRISPLVFLWFGRRGRFVDTAGGCGLLTRLMRDRGFDFHWSDKYAGNLLARGFESAEGTAYALATAFEVLEHVPDPIRHIEETFRSTSADTLLFSTELYAGPPPDPDQWPYYAFETGQHVCFYQRRTLLRIAERLGLKLLSSGSLHALTRRRLPMFVFRVLTHRWTGAAFSWVLPLFLRSRTASDSALLSQRNG